MYLFMFEITEWQYSALSFFISIEYFFLATLHAIIKPCENTITLVMNTYVRIINVIVIISE